MVPHSSVGFIRQYIKNVTSKTRLEGNMYRTNLENVGINKF